MKIISKKISKGFTLIEMLVVVLIIGILAGIALPQYRLVVEKARMTEAITIMKAIADANERFYMLNGRYANAFEIDKLDVEIPGNILQIENLSNKRLETKFFIYSPDGDWIGDSSSPSPMGYKALAQRKPLQERYILYLDSKNILKCSKRSYPNPTQIELCDQINAQGYL